MRYLTAGYSHGKCLIGILTDMCYGMPIEKNYIAKSLKNRRETYARGKRQKIEDDNFEIVSGLYNGKTDGNPIGVIIYNKKNKIKEFNYYTPGYGDLYGALKYQHNDTFVIKERASARESVVRVALFSFTKRFLELLDINIESYVIKCYKEKDDKKFLKIIDNFKEDGDSFGGIFEIKIKNIFPGIGDYSDPSKRLQSLISRELFTIGSLKGVEFGQKNIEEIKGSEITKNQKILGGIQCGISDGNDILIRCKTRAISSIKIPTQTTDLKTFKKKYISHNTSDISSVFAAAYISEFIVSYVIASEILKFFPYKNFDKIRKEVKIWRKNAKKIIKNIKT